MDVLDRVGGYVGNHYSGALCYADDLTLISPSSNSMNRMVNICEMFADEYSVKFNSSTSIVVTFNVNVDVSFMLNNKPIAKVDIAVHLGHIIGNELNVKHASL